MMILRLSWIHIGLTLCSLLYSNPLHQAGCVWFALAPVLLLPWCFSTVFICKSRQTTIMSEMTKTLFGFFMFYIWWSWVVHCWITLPLQKTYLGVVVWLFMKSILISNVCNNPIMIQSLLLTSFFIDNKTKPNTIIESFPCWNSYMWVHHCYITSLSMFWINDFTSFYVFH